MVATTNRLDPVPLPAAPANAVVVDWLSYSQVMPQASLVVCHGGHGTVARALAAGVPVLCCPHVGDMAENAARVAWAGAGLMLPWRLLGTGALRVAGAGFSATDVPARACEFAAWWRANDGAEHGARLVEQLVRQ